MHTYALAMHSSHAKSTWDAVARNCHATQPSTQHVCCGFVPTQCFPCDDVCPCPCTQQGCAPAQDSLELLNKLATLVQLKDGPGAAGPTDTSAAPQQQQHQQQHCAQQLQEHLNAYAPLVDFACANFPLLTAESSQLFPSDITKATAKHMWEGRVAQSVCGGTSCRQIAATRVCQRACARYMGHAVDFMGYTHTSAAAAHRTTPSPANRLLFPAHRCLSPLVPLTQIHSPPCGCALSCPHTPPPCPSTSFTLPCGCT